jgi:hypothetical protein
MTPKNAARLHFDWLNPFGEHGTHIDAGLGFDPRQLLLAAARSVRTRFKASSCACIFSPIGNPACAPPRNFSSEAITRPTKSAQLDINPKAAAVIRNLSNQKILAVRNAKARRKSLRINQLRHLHPRKNLG